MVWTYKSCLFSPLHYDQILAISAGKWASSTRPHFSPKPTNKKIDKAHTLHHTHKTMATTKWCHNMTWLWNKVLISQLLWMPSKKRRWYLTTRNYVLFFFLSTKQVVIFFLYMRVSVVALPPPAGPSFWPLDSAVVGGSVGEGGGDSWGVLWWGLVQESLCLGLGCHENWICCTVGICSRSDTRRETKRWWVNWVRFVNEINKYTAKKNMLNNSRYLFKWKVAISINNNIKCVSVILLYYAHCSVCS